MSLSVVMPIGIYSAQTGMVQAQRTFEKAAESIASGIKQDINPADIYVATGLDTSLRSSQKALENAQTGYNFTSVADNALGSVTQNLQRIRELSIQAANGVYSDSQRAAMQAEIDMNVEQIKQTLNQAEFNGKPTINAVTPENPEAASVVDFMVNPDNSSVITYDPNITLDSMNFDVSSSQAAAANLDKLTPSDTTTVDVAGLGDKCRAAMDDDLNSPIVISHLFEAAKAINSIHAGTAKINASDLAELKSVFHSYAFDILGLREEEQEAAASGGEAFEGAVNLLLQLRQEAKANKDWATADKIRNRLSGLGFTLKDTKDGTEWRL